MDQWLGGKMKYWIESSWDFEDQDREYPEHWVVAVDYGKDENETESIATFDKSVCSNLCPIRESIEDLLKHVNISLEEK